MPASSHSTMIAGSIALFTLLTGCQSGTATTPTPSSPANATGDLALGAHANELPLAMAHLRIDGATGAVEVSPVRLNTAIGDAYIVGLNALRRNFEVTGITRQSGPDGPEVILDCAFTHPFPNATRPDLMGWDLKAIVATDESMATFNGVRVPTDIVNNAAGYTEEWTPEIQAALPTIASNAFPYIILGEDRTAPAPFVATAPAGYNCFPPGSVATGQLVLDIDPGETLEVDLFFTVGFQVAATRATRQTPDYQPPRGNMRAAWRVDAAINTNTLTTAIGSFALVDLNIWDWQHGQSLDSDVVGISVSAPDLTATPITPTIGGGSGRDTDPLTASFAIANTLGTFAGDSTFALIEVRDALDGVNPGGNVPENGVDLIEDDFTTIRTPSAIRTYQVLSLTVDPSAPGTDPIAAVTSCPALSAGALSVPKDFLVTWDATTSSDPDPGPGPESMIVGWEWDFEWDAIPASFTDDTAGAGTAVESHIYATIGTTHLGLRVEDGVGRKSAILDIPITVTSQDVVLNLQAIENLTAWGENRREYGATLVQEADNTVVCSYTGALASNHENAYSAWNGTSWGVGGYNFSSSGAEFGWFLKSNPNWLNNNTLNMVAHTDSVLHEPIFGTGFGYVSPGFNLMYGIASNYSYAFETVGHRTTGHVYAFGDLSSQIVARRAGPNGYGIPVFDWPTNPATVVPNLVDGRPSQLSRVRSAESCADGSIHLAYRAADGSQLRYAKDSAGLNTSWSQQDLATDVAGSYGDPAISHDEATGMYIAVAHNTAGSWRIEIFRSNDLGASWLPAMIAGPTFAAKPMDLSLSVRTLFCQQVYTIGYATALAPATSEIRARYSRDEGASWDDVLLSTAADGYSPDSLVTRTGGNFYAAWAADVAGRSNVLVRRGVYAIQ